MNDSLENTTPTASHGKKGLAARVADELKSLKRKPAVKQKASAAKRKSTKPARKHSAAKRKAREPRAESKSAAVIAMMSRAHGASAADIMEKTGWQPHTVRGFVATAKAKRGLKVESFKRADGARAYKVNS